MQRKQTRQKPRQNAKPSKKTLDRGLRLGRAEWDRVLLETVENLGEATATDIANAADLDPRRLETALRRLVKAGRIRKTTEYRYSPRTSR